MNKLISRNPVLRFKLGRKLIKAQFGWHVREDGVVVNSAGVPIRKLGAGYRPYSMTQDVSYLATWPSDRQIAPGLYLESGTNDVYASRPEEDESAVGNLISKGSEPPANGIHYETTNASGAVVDRGTQRKRAYYLVDPTDGSKYLIGTDGSKTLVSKGNKSNNSSRTRVTNVSNSAQLRNPGAYRNITTWQNKLKDFYEPGTFAVDGIWGKNTEAAYQKYLQSLKTPNEIKEEAWRNAPQSQARNVYNLALNIATPKVLEALNNKQIPEVSGIYSFLKPAQTSEVPVIDINKISSTGKFYNKADVRNYMRRHGFNPYSYTADYRIALRKVLNGQGSQDDYNMVRSMGIKFKKGGLLPSRNSIQRFKNRNFN